MRESANSHAEKSCRRIWVMLLIVPMVLVLSPAVAFAAIFRRLPPPDLGSSVRYTDLDPLQFPRFDVRFPSGGNMLFGSWFPRENSAGTVLIAHGMGSSGEAHLPETLFFLQHGFSVFTYDATGMGRSEGRNMVGLAQSKQDVISAAKYLQQRGYPQPLYLYGHSMGGYGVLAALPEISARAAVCLNGFRTPIGLMHLSARRYVGFLADMVYPLLCLQNRFRFGRYGNTDALSAAGEAKIPVMIFNGQEDSLIPEKVKLHFEDGISDTINFTTVDGGHTGIWLSKEGELNEGLMNKILGFYQSTT